MDNLNPDFSTARPAATSSSTGPLVGTVIIIIVLVIGAAVVFYQQYKQSREWQNTEPAPLLLEAESPELTPLTPTNWPATSTSTDLVDIEEDLGAADLFNLEAELDALNTDLD